MTARDDEFGERLSALLDGELSPEKADEAVEAILADPAARDRWGRYATISDALADRHVSGGESLADRVSAALDGVPTPVASKSPAAVVTALASRAPRPSVAPPARAARSRWMPALALAASVAVMAVAVGLYLDPASDQDGVATAPPAVASAPRADPSPGSPGVPIAVPVRASREDSPTDTTALTRLTWNDPRPGVEQRLNGYLLNHNEYLATGVRGMLPYARVVGYEPHD